MEKNCLEVRYDYNLELGIPYPCSPDLEGLEGIVPDGSMVDC